MHIKQTLSFLHWIYRLISSAQRVYVPDEQPQRLLGLHCSVQWPLGRLCLRCSLELRGALSGKLGRCDAHGAHAMLANMHLAGLCLISHPRCFGTLHVCAGTVGRRCR